MVLAPLLTVPAAAFWYRGAAQRERVNTQVAVEAPVLKVEDGRPQLGGHGEAGIGGEAPLLAIAEEGAQELAVAIDDQGAVIRRE